MRRSLSGLIVAIIAVTFVAIPVALTPGRAGAFAEDICYTPGEPPHSCAPLPFACPDNTPHDPVCGARAFFRYAYTLRQPLGGRSLIHSDSVYIMARSVGFPVSQAYWMAAYSEATDLGKFAPRDMRGNLVPNAAELTTKDMSGLVRTHFTTGGFLFHLVPTLREAGSPKPNGLAPNPMDPREIMLSHVRRWAWAGHGSAVPLCTGGFTNRVGPGDYSTGSECYGAPGSVPINGQYSLIDPVAIPYTIPTGRQILSGAVRSQDFDAWVGAPAPAARIGIYLHVLGDRISHHMCNDEATVTPPTPKSRAFIENLDKPGCNQGVHSVRHEYETGVDFATLHPEDRTTEAYLSMAYDELVAFARERGTLDARATSPAAKAAVTTNGLVPALQVRNPEARLRAVTAAGCRVGVPAFPGSPAC